MAEKLQPVRGTHDILPDESAKRKALVGAVQDVFALYGYGEIQTPVFEFTDVFHRTLGDTSDVVTKETYTFEDRGGESLTLRPEFTASVVRAFISNGLQETLPFKVHYHGPAFRYERPQKGRLRQFHQVGAEILGVNEPVADIEMIAMAAQALDALGLSEHVTLELNSLGDTESRAVFRSKLVEYFSDHKNALSDDSRNRLDKNPLRILDSKDEGDRKLIANAPTLHAHFTPASADFYGEVKSSLSALRVAYKENARLVRGLDYYSHTVFEFTTDKLGAQGTVLAGGRYDGLVKLMGGQDIAGVGFAAGVERLLALCEAAGNMLLSNKRKRFAVIPMGEAEEREALLATQALRSKGIMVELLTRGNMGKKMKRAEKLGAAAVVIIGEEEMKTGQFAVKDMRSGEQQNIAKDTLAEMLRTLP